MRALPVHLIAIATLIASVALVALFIGPALPRGPLLVTVSATAVYVVAWLAMLGAGVLGRSSPHRRAANRAIGWGGNVVIITMFWLCMPYASEAVRLLAVTGVFATTAVQVLSAIEPPPATRRRPLMQLALPISTALYFLAHWERFSWVIAPYALAYAFNAMTLRGIVQRAVDRAHAARVTAEAALAQVAAERDAKTRFLASASHDLGQPLQAARLFFDQAMAATTTAQRAAAARNVTWAFDTTEQLLRQVLDHLRLEAGAVEPRIEVIAVGPLIARIAEVNEPAARLAGVSIAAMPSRIAALADVQLTERALGNLVSNAVRHAKARRILVGARRRDERVRLWVIDDGRGIAPADAQRLFQDYIQGADHGDEIRGGFGLGLGSARRMAELMGGEVGLDPKWTHGSAFWLELRAAEAKAG